nr:gamma-glutamylcyclotransferase [uncultured Dongia sp.]
MTEAEMIERRRYRPKPGEDLHVFAYGSLMWRPDFPFVDIQPATLYGYHRAFCITSTHYRGSEEHPGLVLGLDRGGQCLGRLYRVAPMDAEKAADYLHRREMVTGVYIPRLLKVRLNDGKDVTALSFIADRAHAQYAGKLSADEVVAKIRDAVGIAGPNIDYLRNTVLHLDEMGIGDCALHRILRMIDDPKDAT